MSEELRELFQLAGAFAAANPPDLADWAAVEEDLGFGLQTDYKELVSAFGDGIFGKLVLRNPVSLHESRRLNLVQQLAVDDTLRKRIHTTGAALYPAQPGYLCVSGNGHAVTLLMRPIHKETGHRELLWCDFDDCVARPITTNLARFLTDLYLRRSQQAWMLRLRDIMWEPNQRLFIPFPTEPPDW